VFVCVTAVTTAAPTTAAVTTATDAPAAPVSTPAPTALPTGNIAVIGVKKSWRKKFKNVGKRLKCRNKNRVKLINNVYRLSV